MYKNTQFISMGSDTQFHTHTCHQRHSASLTHTYTDAETQKFWCLGEILAHVGSQPRKVRRSPSHCQRSRADDRWLTETFGILDIISPPDFGFKHKDRHTQRRLTARNTQTDTCTALTLISINKQSLVVVKILCQTNPAPPFFPPESSFGHFQTFIS